MSVVLRRPRASDNLNESMTLRAEQIGGGKLPHSVDSATHCKRDCVGKPIPVNDLREKAPCRQLIKRRISHLPSISTERGGVRFQRWPSRIGLLASKSPTPGRKRTALSPPTKPPANPFRNTDDTNGARVGGGRSAQRSVRDKIDAIMSPRAQRHRQCRRRL